MAHCQDHDTFWDECGLCAHYRALASVNRIAELEAQLAERNEDHCAAVDMWADRALKAERELVALRKLRDAAEAYRELCRRNGAHSWCGYCRISNVLDECEEAGK